MVTFIVLVVLLCFMGVALRSIFKGTSSCHKGCSSCSKGCISGHALYEAYHEGTQNAHAKIVTPK